MKDLWHGILKYFDYDRGKVFGVIIGLALFAGLIGCQPVITSPITGEKIDRDMLSVEIVRTADDLAMKRDKLAIEQQAYNRAVDTFNLNIEAAEQQFKKIEEFQASLLDISTGVLTTAASGNPIDAVSVITSLIALVGVGGAVGGMYDSSRKNKIIEELKVKQT